MEEWRERERERQTEREKAKYANVCMKESNHVPDLEVVIVLWHKIDTVAVELSGFYFLRSRENFLFDSESTCSLTKRRLEASNSNTYPEK